MACERGYTRHAIDRFFSRYRIEITPEELLYIQHQIRYGLDGVTYLGRMKSSNVGCYHGIHQGIEYFAICPLESFLIITFFDLNCLQDKEFVMK